MKILFFSHAFYPAIGGIESISEMLVEEFLNAGHEIHLMTWTASPVEQNGAYQITRRPGLSAIVQAMRWADIIFENNPCIRMSWPNLLIRKPLVTGLQTWVANADGSVTLQKALKKQWLKFSTKLIACSNAIKHSIPLDSIVIGNPYNERVFKQNKSMIQVYDFVFLGRLVSDKGVFIALEAFYQFCKLYKNSRLTIIGDGPEREKLELQVKEYKLESSVLFKGALRGNSIVEVLNIHKYILVPSLWKEPFGIVALEGLACGCIPIVADGGGLPDAVGEAGLVFTRGSAISLFKRMTDLIENDTLHQKLKDAAAIQLNKHSSANVSVQYLAIFNEAINLKA
jgi:glycosyltransferase involved in cell wall biosynthesis